MLFLPMGKPRKGVFQDNVLEVGQSKRNQLITELGSILNIDGPILLSTYTFQFNWLFFQKSYICVQFISLQTTSSKTVKHLPLIYLSIVGLKSWNRNRSFSIVCACIYLCRIKPRSITRSAQMPIRCSKVLLNYSLLPQSSQATEKRTTLLNNMHTTMSRNAKDVWWPNPSRSASSDVITLK